MENAKHTPGPWIITNGCSTCNFIYDAEDEDGLMYPFATVEHGDPETLSANTRLIAAAPELLEALIALSTANGANDFNGWHEDFNEAIAKARAAIAKARGES